MLGTDSNDNLVGTDAGEPIFGGAGNDQIAGGGGNDVLVDLDCSRGRSIFAFEVGPRAIANAKLVELSQADDLQLGNGGRPRISTLRVD
jgi:Ca2+-binding RTX toxin-like protein